MASVNETGKSALKQFAQINVSSENAPFSTDDNVIDEMMLKYCGMTINYLGHELIPLISETKIYYIQSGYIKPFGGTDDISYDVRKLENGSEYIAVKEGFLLRAIIMPYDVVKDDFISVLRRIYSLSMAAMSAGKEQARQKIERSEFGNMTFEEAENYE